MDLILHSSVHVAGLPTPESLKAYTGKSKINSVKYYIKLESVKVGLVFRFKVQMKCLSLFLDLSVLLLTNSIV